MVTASQPFGVHDTTTGTAPATLGERMREVRVACPRCGGDRLQRTLSFAGRGNFRHGGVDYSPASVEELRAETHCTCPGGAYWRQLRAGASAEDQRALDRAELDWDLDGTCGRERKVRVPDGEGNLVELGAGQWREYLIAREKAQ